MNKKIYLFSILALSQNLMCPSQYSGLTEDRYRKENSTRNVIYKDKPAQIIIEPGAISTNLSLDLGKSVHSLANSESFEQDMNKVGKTIGSSIGEAMAEAESQAKLKASEKFYENSEEIGEYQAKGNANIQSKITSGFVSQLGKDSYKFGVAALILSSVAILGVGAYKWGISWIEYLLKKPKALEEFSQDEKKLRLSDFEGTEKQKNELKKQIDIINAQRKENKNCGYLLFNGEPGTGKTYSAAIIAKEAGFKVAKKLKLNNVAKAERPTEEFEKILRWARKNKALLFIDEADSILKDRSSEIATAFLDNTGGANSKFDGIIILATNVAIEEAIENRFDVVKFYLPNAEARAKLIKKFKTGLTAEIENGCLDESHIQKIAENIQGLSGRQIRDVMLKKIQPLGLTEKIITKEMVDEEFKEKLDSHNKRKSEKSGEYVRY